MKPLTIACLAVLLAPTSPAAIRYVDLDASGADNGTSWTNAYLSLQATLTAAANGDEIHVAQGKYHPSVDETGDATPANARTKTFLINKNITLYDGFRVSAGELEARDIDQFRTVLSGDIGTPNNVSDNCYHVMIFEGVFNSCRLDGFYVQEGQANGAEQSDKAGAAIYLRATLSPASPHISNCRIERNTGTRGAVFLEVYDNDNDTRFSNCRFSGNFGGISSALHSTISGLTTQNLTFDNCIFTKSTGPGSVITLAAESEVFAQVNVQFNNCTIGGNTQAQEPTVQLEATNVGTIVLNARNSIFCNPLAAGPEIFAAVRGSETYLDLDYCFLAERDCAAITAPGTEIKVTCGSNMIYNTGPQFADIGRGVLLPTLGAPTIDEGETATATSTDYLGVRRPILGGPDIGACEFPGLQRPKLTVRVNAARRMVLNWSCLTGETYTLRRTRDFINYDDFVTGFPAGGAKTWNLEFISNSVDIPSIPRLFYQVVRE